MKKVKVLVEKYESSDGQIFDTEKQCDDHERRINGTRKTCPCCKGTKTVDYTGDGRTFVTCSKCNGKGYVEKVEEWK